MNKTHHLVGFEIKPCPFCGQKDFDVFCYGRVLAGAEAIKCLNCGAIGPYRFTNYTYSDVVEAWNQRIRGIKNEVDD